MPSHRTSKNQSDPPIFYVKTVDVPEGRFWQVRDRRDERIVMEYVDPGYAKREADELNRLGVGA